MHIHRNFIFIGMILLLFGGDLWAQKIDTIYFQEGDRITGEVKSLVNNYLKISTNDVSTINVKWNKIDSVKILSKMTIMLTDGQIYYGILMPSGEDGSCFIWATVGEPRLTPLAEIVSLYRLEDKFFNRLTGTISSGFSYTKANDHMQVNLNGSLQYTAQKNQMELYYNGLLTQQDSLDASQRQSGGLTFRRILPNNWFLVSKWTAESNSEQNLDLRTGFAIGGGKSVISSNRASLRFGTGIQANRELSKGDSQNSVEGLVSSEYSMFIYDSPKLTFNLSGHLIPSLSDLGRMRVDVDSNISWEIFSDFYLKWTLYYTFDSRPLSVTASKSDWAITLLGIEYKLN